MCTPLSPHPHEPETPSAQLGRLRPESPGRPSSDPLVGLDMRVTHRTLLVLEVMSDQPRASNDEISARAEIKDRGQISRLLARLARLGLAESSGGRQAGLEANAWTLTARGLLLQARFDAR
jgi:hypothetical protein